MTSNEREESPFYIGSIYTGVDNERRRALMESFDMLPVQGEYCDVCEYDRVCDGGCVANNYMITGYVNELPEMYCWWRRAVLHEAMRVKEAEQCLVVA